MSFFFYSQFDGCYWLGQFKLLLLFYQGINCRIFKLPIPIEVFFEVGFLNKAILFEYSCRRKVFGVYFGLYTVQVGLSEGVANYLCNGLRNEPFSPMRFAQHITQFCSKVLWFCAPKTYGAQMKTCAFFFHTKQK